MQNENQLSSDRPLIGIAYMLLAMCLVPGIDICGKLLGERIGVGQLTLGRYVFHILWLIPVLYWTDTPIFSTPKKPIQQFYRGFFLCTTTAFFFLAIIDNPIPNALALVFIAPLIVAVLAPLVLGEKMGPRRLIAALIGFGGVLMIINPRLTSFSPSLLYALAAGVTFGAYLLITRMMKSRDAPLVTLFYTGLVGVILSAPFAAFDWITPNAREWFLLALMGLFAAAGHYFVILAFEYGEASTVAPFQYFEIVTASIISYIIFGFFPSSQVWIGILIICASGLFISWRETRLNLPARQIFKR